MDLENPETSLRSPFEALRSGAKRSFYVSERCGAVGWLARRSPTKLSEMTGTTLAQRVAEPYWPAGSTVVSVVSSNRLSESDGGGHAMRIASFNVENLFQRARALNTATRAEGKPIVEKHARINELIKALELRSVTTL
jgi:hypothetical protein